MAKAIQRITMFKVPDPANVQPILDKYSSMLEEARKDGKPYILKAEANRTIGDPRNQGYAICARTTFASLEDMKYYDEECEAHKSLKATAKGKVDPPPLVLYFEVDQ
ncbi:hypothetical protein H2203_000640 [Taxawa tesnikishii (nom. ined.)]|nr:hypothetical protein H2203_000640 [Dothideales sp. JES 119]